MNYNITLNNSYSRPICLKVWYSKKTVYNTYALLISGSFCSQPQIGSYFGAEVCVVDLNNDKNTDLLLVSAPTYTEGDREGKVFVYYNSHRVSERKMCR